MREHFQEQLDEITGRLVGMTRKAGEQINAATTALLEADIQLADQTVAADASINRDQLEIDEQVLELMARRSRATFGPRFRRCATPPTWSGWATWPYTSRRSPGCATP
ncbi:MAG TPA: PhoU domain-containing protein, partial [Jiangellaceae bacterium]|nr:PhoU domain-containing protein [Jiangellaceae bacterium]